jgi:hypothetical protein
MELCATDIVRSICDFPTSRISSDLNLIWGDNVTHRDILHYINKVRTGEKFGIADSFVLSLILINEAIRYEGEKRLGAAIEATAIEGHANSRIHSRHQFIKTRADSTSEARNKQREEREDSVDEINQAIARIRGKNPDMSQDDIAGTVWDMNNLEYLWKPGKDEEGPTKKTHEAVVKWVAREFKAHPDK